MYAGEGTHQCNSEQKCRNSPGSYQCSCLPGYKENASSVSGCSDLDECVLSTHQCKGNQSCLNTIASYVCTCSTGLVVSSNLPSGCVDIHECSVQVAVCRGAARCANMFGSYLCVCPVGYSYNSTLAPHCLDVWCGMVFLWMKIYVVMFCFEKKVMFWRVVMLIRCLVSLSPPLHALVQPAPWS